MIMDNIQHLNLQPIPSQRHCINYVRYLTNQDKQLLSQQYTPEHNSKDFILFCYQDKVFVFHHHTRHYIAHMTLSNTHGRFVLSATEINAKIKKHTALIKAQLDQFIDHVLTYNYING